MARARPLATSPNDTTSPAAGPGAERSYFGIVVLIFGAYLLLATGLYFFRGFRFITPERWLPFLFLAALALGRGRVFIRDWIPFVALLFGYQYMRGVAGEVAGVDALSAENRGSVQLDWLLDWERWLFLGNIPSIWLQERLFTKGEAHWYDVMSALVYLLHFVFPLVFAFVVWIRNKDSYWRFMVALTAMSYIAFLSYLLLPTAPPWLAQEWGVIQGLERPSGQAYQALLPPRADNFDTFQLWTKASPNPVAAFPSLHAAYPWLVMLYARKFFGRVGWVFLAYNAAVWFCVVYFGLHWVIDLVVGAALATAVYVATERLWPRLAASAGITLPAPLTAAAAGTWSAIDGGVATARRRMMTLPLAREAPGALAVAATGAVGFLYVLQKGSMVGINSALEFYPGYAFLGEQLRAGNLPAWMPHWYGGMPFIADPQSGWLYLPAMVVFTLIPLKWAIQLFLALHLLLMGLGTYALGRLLGLGMVASVVAAAAFQLNGWMSVRMTCCPAEFEVMTWLPVALVGVELAVRAGSWLGRAGGWGLAGLAMSQILAAWLGQGGLYASLAVGGYIAYRTLLDPPAPLSIRRRVTGFAVHGGAIGILSFGLVAAALLPRLEFLSVSSLAEGYPWEGVRGGWPSLESLAMRVLGRTSYYAGAATLALAGVGVVLGRRRHATPFFALLALFAMVLSLRERTPLHRLLETVVPRFEDVNSNLPERSLMVFFLAVAMLAGIAVQGLSARSFRGVSGLVALVPVGLLGLLTVGIARGNPFVGQWTLIAIAAVGAVVLGAWLPWFPALRSAAPLLLVAVLLADLLTASQVLVHENTPGVTIMRADLTRYDDPPPAAAFMQSQRADGPFRFFGYDAGSRRWRSRILYRSRFPDPAMTALVVNNRGAFHGLEDLQGTVNPIQVARYDELLAAVNGFPQEYHDANVFPSGLDSPLLDVLNVRFIVVPAAVPPGRPDLLHLSQRRPTVFADGEVRVVENTRALPRAWIVHAAEQVPSGEALPLMTSGRVDLAEVAVLEGAPPDLAAPQNPAADSVKVHASTANSVELTMRTDAPGMVVLSEIYDPAWKAYLDGEAVPMVVADHALRAVAVPAGTHELELRYESDSLRLGLLLSGLTTLLVLGVGIALAARAWRTRR